MDDPHPVVPFSRICEWGKEKEIVKVKCEKRMERRSLSWGKGQTSAQLDNIMNNNYLSKSISYSPISLLSSRLFIADNCLLLEKEESTEERAA